MHAAFRVLLIVALLHAQMPCGAALGPPAPCCQVEQRDHAPAAGCGCGCCDEEPAGVAKEVSPPPAEERQPCAPAGCPANCPCVVCSSGYVPLTDFATVTLPVAAAVDPSLRPADPSRGHAGHHQLPDRPPRLV